MNKSNRPELLSPRFTQPLNKTRQQPVGRNYSTMPKLLLLLSGMSPEWIGVKEWEKHAERVVKLLSRFVVVVVRNSVRSAVETTNKRQRTSTEDCGVRLQQIFFAAVNFVVRTNVCGSLYWSNHIVNFATWPIWPTCIAWKFYQPSAYLEITRHKFYFFFWGMGNKETAFSTYTFFNFTPFIMYRLRKPPLFPSLWLLQCSKCKKSFFLNLGPLKVLAFIFVALRKVPNLIMYDQFWRGI